MTSEITFEYSYTIQGKAGRANDTGNIDKIITEGS